MLELVLRLVAGGAVLVGAVVALRWAQSRGMTARGGPALRVVGRTGLTKSSLVAVVAVDDRQFLVGAGDQGVQLLAELAPAEGEATPANDPPALLAAQDPDACSTGPALFGATGAARAGTAAAPAHDLAGGDVAVLERTDDALPDLGTHGRGAPHDGPRIGPLDRLRAMTVRTHSGEPIRDHHTRR